MNLLKNMDMRLKNMDIRPEAMAMALRDEAVALFRRYRVWVLGAVVLLVVVFAGWMFVHRQNDNALSAEFRSPAEKAYEAITSCENYKPYGGDSWRARELDAELSVAGAIAVAKTHADLRAAMALSDYLHEVKLVHLVRQNRDPKNAKHDYAQSTRELKTARQKAQTAIQVS
jgi:hypothetical protein